MVLTAAQSQAYREVSKHLGHPRPTPILLYGPAGSGRHTVVVEIVDSGRAFDPTSLVSPDTAAGLEERPIGGLGIHLVRTMVDGMEYRREGSRNLLNLIMDTAAAEEGS